MDNNRNWAGWAALGLAALALLVALSGRGGGRSDIGYAYRVEKAVPVPAAPQAPVAPAVPAVPVMPAMPVMPMSPKMMPPAAWQWQGAQAAHFGAPAAVGRLVHFAVMGFG